MTKEVLAYFWQQIVARIERSFKKYPVTISTTWSGSTAPYTQSITVEGIEENDTPITDLILSGVYETDQVMITDWGKIYRIVTAANEITVYATEKTSVALPIQLQVVR